MPASSSSQSGWRGAVIVVACWRPVGASHPGAFLKDRRSRPLRGRTSVMELEGTLRQSVLTLVVGWSGDELSIPAGDG